MLFEGHVAEVVAADKCDASAVISAVRARKTSSVIEMSHGASNTIDRGFGSAPSGRPAVFESPHARSELRLLSRLGPWIETRRRSAII
jgi:hypothetical protein